MCIRDRSEIILKFGLFGIITTILDILWQIVFPLMGFPDYNDLVYRNVKHPELENLTEEGEQNVKQEKLGEREEKLDQDVVEDKKTI